MDAYEYIELLRAFKEQIEMELSNIETYRIENGLEIEAGCFVELDEKVHSPCHFLLNYCSSKNYICPFLKYIDRKSISSSESTKTANGENAQTSSDGFDDNAIKLMVGPDEEHFGYNKLKIFLKGVKKLIITDPYFYSISKSRSNDYVSIFKDSIGLGRLESIHLVYSDRSQHVTSKVRSEFKQFCDKNKCEYSEKKTFDIHDRVWIADRSKAIAVGTSLNGLGNRLAFVVDLADEDLTNFLAYLDHKGLSRR